MDLNKDHVIQAVVIADTFSNNFHPMCMDKPMSLLPIVGVPIVNFVLDSLAQGGVDETILFCCRDGPRVKEYVNECIKNKTPWSLTMEVQVLISETCQSMGDAMREIDAAGLIRGHFVLTGVNTITNIPFAALLEQHKQICKKDKGAAMTLVYEKVCWGHPLIMFEKPIFLAASGNTNKILIHNKYKQKSNEKNISLPLEVVLSNSEVKLHHNLADSNIALCSPSVLPLFSDNFDFQTKDHFIHGILINEEILNSSLYYLPLQGRYYAACVSNWKTYQSISRDILHHWTHPLSIETGSLYRNNFALNGNHNYVNKSATLSRSCILGENVLIGANTDISDNTKVSKSIIGKGCKIGKNVVIDDSFVQDGVTIKDSCTIVNSFIDNNCVVDENCILEDGTMIVANTNVEKGSELRGDVIINDSNEKEKLPIKSTSETTDWENESGSSNDDDDFVSFEKEWSESESYCTSVSSEDLSMPDSPEPEDTNIFLQEVIDSLARGYEEKLKCDYLILEINSSRYAYNIQLNEVNFFVVRALLSMPILNENKNALKDILRYFRPILSNYIKSKSSIMDCLKAVEDSCLKCDWLDGRSGQIVNLLYEAEVVDEDSLTEWKHYLEQNGSPIINHASLVKFFDWLDAASEESDDSE